MQLPTSFRAFSLLLAANAALLLPTAAHDVEELITELGATTRTAAGTGNFSVAATWGGTLPNQNDVVEVPAGITVTVDNTSPIARTVVVRGTLKFSTTASSRLRVETLVVADGGKLIVGDYGANQAIPNQFTATILIRDVPTITQDSERLARGIVTSHLATVRMKSGNARAPFVAFNGNLGPSTTGNIQTTAAVPASWRVGDEVVIPATTFTREWLTSMTSSDNTRLRNETRTVSAIATGATPGITLGGGALAYQHTRADATIPEIRVHAANLTRNIVIQSQNTTEIARFGHVMFMGGDVKLTGVAFIHLGRTDKRSTVSDPALATSTYNVPGGNKFSNPRGRYACHFHKGGTATGDPVASVAHCVVRGTPGWGFVNHSARVDFTGNVAFDFDGAGFVAEDGDELGSYTGNIAIGGTGNGEFPNQRSVFGNVPRLDQGDMGFTGEGFWLQSPDVTVSNNIAAGCKGAGFFFWCAGRFDPATGNYTGRPLSRALLPGVNPRKWDYDGNGTADAVLVADMPLAGCTGNIAYACFMGLKLRFVNDSNLAIYDEVRKGAPALLDLENKIFPAAGYAPSRTQADRVDFPISNCTFWNNLNGIHASYLRNCDFSGVKIIASGARATDPGATEPPYSQDAGLGAIGLDFHHVNIGNTLTDVTIKNYTTGAWHSNNVSLAGVTFTGCTENSFNTAGSDPKGYDWFFLIFNTDNLPDNPQ